MHRPVESTVASRCCDVAVQDPRFDSAVDKKTGYVTKNMLVMPIKCQDEIVGKLSWAVKRATWGCCARC